jgi:hypothetical protein
MGDMSRNKTTGAPARHEALNAGEGVRYPDLATALETAGLDEPDEAGEGADTLGEGVKP